MAALFFRDGRPFEGAHRLTIAGKPVTTITRKCGRCGGAGGADQWKATGWTCFQCGGSGRDADAFNARHGITAAQVEAMMIGSVFGWDVPGADPANAIGLAQ